MSSLQDIRVIEVGGSRSSQVTGALLVALGAEVIQVEPAEGMDERRHGPRIPGISDHAEAGISHAYYAAGKKSVVLDEADVDELLTLARGADVVLDGGDTPLIRRLSTAEDPATAWASILPEAIVCRVSPFGDTGPWSEYRSSDLVSLALGGVMAACGYDDEPFAEPIAPAGGQAGHITAMNAVSAILAAILARESMGTSQYIDISTHESIAVSTEMGLAYWEFQNVNPRRATARHARPYASPPWNHLCKDGKYFCALPLYIDDRQFASLVEWFTEFGLEEDLGAPRYRTWTGRNENIDHVVAVIRRFCAEHNSDYLFHEAQRRHLPWAPVQGPVELLADPQLAHRGFFDELIGGAGDHTAYVPGAPFLMSASPCVPRRHVPTLGEHTGTTSPRDRVYGADAELTDMPEKVLSGIRVVDFTWSVVGPTITRNLAALGAEVIKVEWPRNPDKMRTTMYRAGEPNPTLDNGPFFANLNVGKLSLSLNARSELGLEVIKELVASSDVVVESFSAGVLKNWGLGREELAALNPKLIYVSASGFGHSGPYESYKSWGPSAQAFNGLTSISGLPGLQPAGWGWSYMDVVAGAIGTAGALAAIRHMRRTGEGQHVDLAQVESGLAFQGASLLAAQIPGTPTTWVGNRSLDADGDLATFRGDAGAPYGVYRTAGGGPDDYCAITVLDDDQWLGLCRVIGAHDWEMDPGLADVAGRVAAQDMIDQRLSEWVATRDKFFVMATLQEAGVPAGAVQSPEDRLENDPQLAARGLFEEMDHPELGRVRFQNIPWHLSATPPRLQPVWPSIGEHTEYVLAKFADLGAEQIERLREDHVTWPEGMARKTVGMALW